MKYLATNWSNARGSVGATTYSQNRGGLYAKSRTNPTQPQTPAQQLAQAAFKACVAAWGNTLNQTQRNGWILYGQTNPVVNQLGTSVILSGLNMFQRINIPLFIAGSYSAMELTSPGATPLLMPITINGSTTVDKGITLGGTGTIAYSVTFPSTPGSTDYIVLNITKPNGPGRIPTHQPPALVFCGLISALGTLASTMTFTLPDAFPLNRASDTPYQLRGYWISAANLSSFYYLQGYTL